MPPSREKRGRDSQALPAAKFCGARVCPQALVSCGHYQWTSPMTKRAQASPVEAEAAASQQVEASPGNAGPASPACPSPGSGQKQFKSSAACVSPVVKRLEFLPSPVPSEEAASNEKDVKKPEMEQQKEAELTATPVMMKPKALEQEGSVVLPFLKKLPETSQVTLQNSGLQEPPRGAAVPLRVRNNWRRSQFFSQSADSDSGDKSNRFNFWSWDPEEERKRQERWQHEQERLLQEKYQKEQDKLKEEWEKAQREVEEEERRYYEEERKIIEDTVVPFIVSSNSAELLSSSSSTTEGNKTLNTTDSNSSPEEGKQKEVTRQKKLLWEQDTMPSLKSKENELWQEKRSGNKVLSGHPETDILKGGEQEQQVTTMERSSPARLNLPLTQDVSWNQQLLAKQSPHRTEDIRHRPLLGQSTGQQLSSTGETRRAGYYENLRSGPSSPCSPAAPSQSPNRSVSGKKLCSTCGLPLGKGAAMIIETLGLYFHIQCFRCGICKGQLGDAASGTDVRIRNGLLNCNDCYIRSRIRSKSCKSGLWKGVCKQGKHGLQWRLLQKKLRQSNQGVTKAEFSSACLGSLEESSYKLKEDTTVESCTEHLSYEEVRPTMIPNQKFVVTHRRKRLFLALLGHKHWQVILHRSPCFVNPRPSLGVTDQIACTAFTG
ncbi:hypothetical protein Q9233_015334 [Columba guinea]|nr:hypothetical protein Q9233_015334 [Columba guinea]